MLPSVQGLNHSTLRPRDDGEGSSINASIASTITGDDSTSLTSVESSQVPYHPIDHSTDSNSISFDKTSVSGRSDTEVLLKSEYIMSYY